MARLFVALPVDAGVVARLDAAVAPVRQEFDRASWTRPSGWHVTLAFLGEVPDHRVDTVADVVRDAVAEFRASWLADGPLRLVLGEPGTFGDRVAHVRVGDEPSGAVAALGEAVQQALAGAGLPVERKPVRPHLTLARGRGRGRRLPAGLVERLPTVTAAWTVDAVEVVQSILSGGPARYEAVASLDVSA